MPGIRLLLLLCLFLFVAHLSLDLFLPAGSVLLPSGILLLLETFLAGLACLWRAYRSSQTARLLWAFFGCGELLIFASNFVVGLEFVFFHFPHNQTAPSDFLIFLWGLPVLLALGTPSESKPLCSFYWLDGIQITLLIVFTFIYVFGSLPFVRFSGLPVPGFGSTSAFSIEQFVVALAATLRLQSRPSNRDVRIFWSCACLFLWLHAFCDSTYNFTNYFAASPPFRLQFLLAIPSLCILLCAFAQPNWGKSDARAPYRRNLALSLDNGSPVIFPALVALLAILCAFHHLRFSLVSIALSLFAYGIRSTVMQVRFQNIQLQMERNQAQLQRLALTDPLTGIANRRDFDIRLIQAWEQYVASNQPFSLLLIDVDYFKMLNDTYGHAEGDRCLRSIALVLQSTFRNDNDIVARFGGEEFAAIISEADLASAVSIARRMLRAVETLELRTQNPISDIVTISIGVAFSAGADSATVLLNRADQALYRAKRQGRNRVVSL